MPLGSAGNVSVTDRDLIWKNGTDVYGQTPSDVYGKRVDLPDFPQFLSLMVKGEQFAIWLLYQNYLTVTRKKQIGSQLAMKSLICNQQINIEGHGPPASF